MTDASDPKTPDRDEQEEFSLFENEERVIRRSDEMLARLTEVAEGVRGLSAAYGKSYREQRRLVRLSDRMQHELQSANQRLAEQAADLARLNTQLKQEVETRRRLGEELRQLAMTDDLTQTYTRRYFLELAARELLRTRRTDEPISLIVADLDHFKHINDAHGHSLGDAALRLFASSCARLLREVDVFGRIGGEEFALLLPGSGLAAAEKVADRLRAAVEQIAIEDAGRRASMTASLGVAQFLPGVDKGIDDLFRRADAALYRAKREGRNRVALAASP